MHFLHYTVVVVSMLIGLMLGARLARKTRRTSWGQKIANGPYGQEIWDDIRVMLMIATTFTALVLSVLAMWYITDGHIANTHVQKHVHTPQEYE